jgi:hypothetical protein
VNGMKDVTLYSLIQLLPLWEQKIWIVWCLIPETSDLSNSLCVPRTSNLAFLNCTSGAVNPVFRAPWFGSLTRALLERPPVFELFENLSTFYGTGRFSTMSPPWARQSSPYHPIAHRFAWILWSYIHIGLPSGLFPSILSCMLHALPVSSSTHFKGLARLIPSFSGPNSIYCVQIFFIFDFDLLSVWSGCSSSNPKMGIWQYIPCLYFSFFKLYKSSFDQLEISPWNWMYSILDSIHTDLENRNIVGNLSMLSP